MFGVVSVVAFVSLLLLLLLVLFDEMSVRAVIHCCDSTFVSIFLVVRLNASLHDVPSINYELNHFFFAHQSRKKKQQEENSLFVPLV